jgi:hypothetical protein
MVNHGLPLGGLDQFADFSETILPPATVTKDAKGLFFETTLDLDDPFQAAISELVSLAVFRWSSGTASHAVRKSADDGHILLWPICEVSLTPTPCEPRLPAIRRL